MMSHGMPNFDALERERIVFEIIQKKSQIHHSALIKLVVPKFMAKTTFEKTRNSLLEKEIISVQLKGNMKFYLPTENYELKFQHVVERNTNNLFHDLKSQIKRLDTDYPHKDVDEKIYLANSILQNLLQTDNGFTILDSSKNPKKTLYRDEHLTIQQLIHQVFEVMRNDKDYDLVFPSVTGCISFVMPKNPLDK